MRNYLFTLFAFMFFNAYGQTENKDSLLTIALELDSIAEHKYEIADDSAAVAIGKQLLTVKEQLYGRQHVEYVKTLTKIAKYIFDIGDYDGAYNFIERSISIINNIPDNHEVRIETYSTLADIYTVQGKL